MRSEQSSALMQAGENSNSPGVINQSFTVTSTTAGKPEW